MLRKKSKVKFFLSKASLKIFQIMMNLLSLYIGYLISYGDGSMLRKKLKLKFFTNKVSLKIFQIIRIPYHIGLYIGYLVSNDSMLKKSRK